MKKILILFSFFDMKSLESAVYFAGPVHLNLDQAHSSAQGPPTALSHHTGLCEPTLLWHNSLNEGKASFLYIR